MRKFGLGLLLALLVVVGTVPPAVAHDDRDRVRAELSGYNEVHFAAGPPATLRGAISTVARGKFKATIDKDEELIRYELSYEGLEGNVTQAHIHFGQPSTVGGIVIWLCQTLDGSLGDTPAPASVAAVTPICPQEGTVTGTIGPSQVLAQALQGIAAGEFDEIVRAIRAGATYANVHSTLHTPGEIRGPIHDRDHDD